MNNIANAINAVLGQAYGQGSVIVRLVAGYVNKKGPDPLYTKDANAEIDGRSGSDFAVPTAVTTAESPNLMTNFNGVQVQSPAVNTNNAYVFELDFEGQAHDVPIGVTVTNCTDWTWFGTGALGLGGTTVFTYGLWAASPVVAVAGDYAGLQGTPQYNASTALTSAGSAVVTYTNQSLQTDQVTVPTDAYGNDLSNVYYRQMAESTDTAGPRVVGWTDGNGVDLLNAPKGTATSVVAKYFVLTFDEPMLADNPATDANSVYNPAKYQIYDNNGNLLSGAIAHIDYGLSEVSQVEKVNPAFSTNPNAAIPDNKWEAVITLNDTANYMNNGVLPDGTYTLKILAAVHAVNGGQTGLCNIYGTPLNLTGYNQPNSASFQALVKISASSNPGGDPVAPGRTETDTPISYAPYRGGQQTDPAVSTTNDLSGTALNGNYVVVWTSDINGQTNIVGQLYKSSGIAMGAEFQVNTTASASWGSPGVAMDSNGNFVVAWSGAGPDSNATTNPSDIYARSYDAHGNALTSQFLVDQYVPGVQQPGVQNQPSIAMSPDGTYVITWTSTPIYIGLSGVSTNASKSVIMAREYHDFDVPLANSLSPQANEFQITPSSNTANTLPDVAMDAHDDFVIVWQGNSSALGVYGEYFTYNGMSSTGVANLTASGVALLNTMPNTTNNFTGVTILDLHYTGPRVSMDPGASAAGFVVTWADYSPTTSNGYNVYARQFGPGGSSTASGALNSASAVTVNTSVTGAGWQVMPAVAVDGQGDITVVWTSYGQDNADNGNPGIADYGIYARIYYSSSTTKATGGKSDTGEFRINATTLGNQVAPAVVSNNFLNDSIMAWVGPDTLKAGTSAIYDRNVDPPPMATAAVINTPPVVTTNPNSQTINAGSPVTFTAAASGTPAPSVQWQVSANGGAYANISGATSTTYSFTTTAVQSGNQYRAVFTSVAGTATTTAATLTVNTPPLVTTNPSSQTVSAGKSVTFTVAATGRPAPSVQWQVSTNNGASFTNISGATLTSYSFTTTAAQAGSQYRAVFTNTAGTATTTAATLMINTAPVVTTNPSSQTIATGKLVTFTAAATGTPVPGVQWQVSTNNGTSFSNIAGATLASYSFTTAATQSGYQYRAVFTNVAGTATTTAAKLTISAATPVTNTAPAVTTNPSSQTITAGNSVMLTAAATGTPVPGVQWQVSTNNGASFSNITGATLASYSFTAATTQSGYLYRAVFTNTAGTATTTAAKLTVSAAGGSGLGILNSAAVGVVLSQRS